MVRLQKYLADCGVASRRGSEEIIRSGRVRVNGETVTEMGVKIDEKINNETIKGKGGLISTPDSTIKVFVIPTNEELLIARDTRDLISK